MSSRDVAPNARAAYIRRLLDTLSRVRGPVRWRREDPVVCLIGTILAQATTDIQAERAYGDLRRRFPSWARVLAAPHREVARTIRSSGLADQKAFAIHAFLRHLKETRGRFTLEGIGLPRRVHRRTRRKPPPPAPDVDTALRELTRIPGIGVKTAAITLMFGYGADLCAVDTHLLRILRRLRIAPPKASPDRTFRILRPVVPAGRAIELHLQLIRHGRETCRAIRPRCRTCPIHAMCPHPQKPTVADPRLGADSTA